MSGTTRIPHSQTADPVNVRAYFVRYCTRCVVAENLLIATNAAKLSPVQNHASEESRPESGSPKGKAGAISQAHEL